MKQNRIIIVDALRGFALLLIIMAHYVEHFELFAPTVNRWLTPEALDATIFEKVMFIVGGKAYSIFALMFGFSFFIQLNRAEQRGEDFRKKFAWRLMLLLIMGFLHSLVYKGDILHIYALLGFLLIPFYRLKIKHLILIASFFILQVPTIIQTVYTYINPAYEFVPTFGWGIWGEIDNIYTTGSFWDVISINFWVGRTTAWGWTFYTGRYLQLFGLFIVGLIIGKMRLFEKLDENKGLFQKVLMISPVAIAILLFLKSVVEGGGSTGLQKAFLGGLLNMYANIAFTLFYISSLTLLHLRFKKGRFFNALAVYGRMSLTNYVSQAVFGVVFFYNFGFGMYKYMGSTLSLIMGIGFFMLQVEFSKYWLKHYYYGPLEWFWRTLTLRDFSIKMKRDSKTELKPAYVKVKSSNQVLKK